MTTNTISSAIEPSLVTLHVPAPASRAELFLAMSRQLLATDRISDIDAFLEALEEREQLGSTYMGNDLALPHGRSPVVTRPSIVFWQLSEPMTYESSGESGPVTRVVMLAVPDGGAQDHLRALALLARMLVNDEALAALDTAASPEQVVEIVVGFAESHG
jgi:mannitol/fructose-specific phosphotransferase system IIA component (Ntr-type)